MSRKRLVSPALAVAQDFLQMRTSQMALSADHQKAVDIGNRCAERKKQK